MSGSIPVRLASSREFSIAGNHGSMPLASKPIRSSAVR
jgi:hypothetical protein